MGGGIATVFASYLSERLNSLALIDPIALDGYPVNEIQSFGRASALSDEQFMMLMCAADQTVIQIFKTMVHDPNVWNQYSSRKIMKTYVDSSYSAESTSMNMGLKYEALRVLTDRAAILSPGLLLPYDEVKNIRGVEYDDITVPTYTM